MHRSLIAALSALLVAQAAAQTPGSHLAPILANTPPHGLPGERPGTERWIVHFERRSFDLLGFRAAVLTRAPADRAAAMIADLERRVAADQKPFVDAATRVGASIVAQWWLINAAAVDLPRSSLDALRALPNVAYVEPDREHWPVIGRATGVNNHNADYVQSQLGFRGVGVCAGVMDTGHDENMNGSGRPHRTYFPNGNANDQTGGGIGGSRLVVNRQMGTSNADDVHGHGTGVAAIVAGGDWGTPAADHGHAYGARIAGYAIAHNSGGGSTTTTMASAWQSMAADRPRYNIVAANLSYSGSPDPLSAEQKAMDSAALNADIMCCVAAGNDGSSTQNSQSAVNGLAVAAVNPDTHTVAAFSSKGPLSGDTQRFYPDIAGNGVSTIMAQRDNETVDWVASGTSMASPQVCGAATLLRGTVPALSALETKAVLLASTLGIDAKNPTLDRNAYGMGLLRDDLAVALAQRGDYGTQTLSAAQPVWTRPLPVIAGKHYAVAITWHRHDLNLADWSNLDLEVLDNGTVVDASRTARNLYEMVRFRADRTTTLTIRTTALAFVGTASQPFAFAHGETVPTPLAGKFELYGAGCPGSARLPNTCASDNETRSLGGSIGFPGVVYVLELNAASNLQVEGFQLKLSSGGQGNLLLNTFLFDADANGAPNQALGFGSVIVGDKEAFYASRLAAPIALAAGQTFFIGFANPDPTITLGITGSGNLVPYWRNNGAGGTWLRFNTRAWAYRVDCSGGAPGAVPILTNVGLPEIGKPFLTWLIDAPPYAPAVLFLGASDAVWNGLPLPADLTPIGANACWLLSSGELQLPRPVSDIGMSAAVIVVPAVPDLVGQSFFEQWLLLDAAANPLGITTTAAAKAGVGGLR